MSEAHELRDTALRGMDQGRVFDGPFLRLADTARSWQLATYVALAVIAILIVSLTRLAVHSRVLVHVVEVDPIGRSVYAGPARELEHPEPYIRYELAEFLIDLRTIVADRRALFRNRSRALVHATQPVRVMLDRYFDDPANDPRRLALDLYRQVHIRSLLPLSETSWQVQWTETGYARQGSRIEHSSWTSIVEIELTPATERTSVNPHNPLGLFVTNLTWSKTSNQLEGDT